MPVVAPHRAISIVSQSSDPKKAIFEAVGDLSKVHVIGNRVLLATYIRPEKTAGGIIRPDTNKEEDIWQGKAGLVVKIGPDAFRDSEDYSFNGETIEVGQWWVCRVGDAWQVNVNGYPCRIVRDNRFEMRVDDPSIIF